MTEHPAAPQKDMGAAEFRDDGTVDIGMAPQTVEGRPILFCDRCGHESHDDRMDPRCPEFVSANWGPDGPDPSHCGCVDVDALYARCLRAEGFIGRITPDEWATIDKAREVARLTGVTR